jgi:hypothetical protein
METLYPTSPKDEYYDSNYVGLSDECTEWFQRPVAEPQFHRLQRAAKKRSPFPTSATGAAPCFQNERVLLFFQRGVVVRANRMVGGCRRAIRIR